VAGRPITASDRQAAAEIASANAAHEQAIQEAWNKRREAIQAERKAREEAEAAKAAAEGQEPTADTVEGGEGAFPSEMDARPAARPAPAAPSPSPAPVATPAPPAAPEAPAEPEAPKPPPEALLIVINPLAVPDYFTGMVRCTARVQNNGEAPASGISAQVTLRGPDGSVWNRQRVYYRDGALEVDGVWNLEAFWVHSEGNAMPRGIPTVTVDLDYQKN